MQIMFVKDKLNNMLLTVHVQQLLMELHDLLLFVCNRI